jgi:2-(3-amino-3-carboxypropyl)histidine synthase
MDSIDYDLELDKVAAQIKKENAKRVCIQLPDGLKPKAMDICSELKKKADAEIIIWLGYCFGACDIPSDVEKLGVDLIVQFGHSEWEK